MWAKGIGPTADQPEALPHLVYSPGGQPGPFLPEWMPYCCLGAMLSNLARLWQNILSYNTSSLSELMEAMRIKDLNCVPLYSNKTDCTSLLSPNTQVQLVNPSLDPANPLYIRLISSCLLNEGCLLINGFYVQIQCCRCLNISNCLKQRPGPTSFSKRGSGLELRQYH